MSRHPRLARILPWSFIVISLVGALLSLGLLIDGGVCPLTCSPVGGCGHCPTFPYWTFVLGLVLLVLGPSLWVVTARARSDWASCPLPVAKN